MNTSGKKRWIINLPLFGKLAKAFFGGALLTNKIETSALSWKNWLQKKYNG